jgi:hypothetical protein
LCQPARNPDHLRFYHEDCESGGTSVIAFVNRYAPERIPADFEIRFIPYEWTIANARGHRKP